ncbi:hypothetical protein JXB11_04620 [Candidatus Woesearchaeota archaeon]|nr:hypothetical protein [Candidatus Woesearchaeota archaeon]
MKHPFSLTFALIIMFAAAQVAGLLIVNQYFDEERTAAEGAPVYKDLPLALERPQLGPVTALIFIIFAVLIGTGLLFMIIRFKKFSLWKLWYFLSVFITLTIALAAFIPGLISAIIAFIASLLKILKPNFVIHNLTELFIYGGLAAIFVPILNVWVAALLLLLISAYDAYAVWKSKHMVKLAKFQTSAGLFAGLSLPYKAAGVAKPPKEAKVKAVMAQSAVVGGGDIGFPLIFAGTVMLQVGFYKALVIPALATIALTILLIIGKKGHFYPAMPFLTAGCLIGYGITLLL